MAIKSSTVVPRDDLRRHLNLRLAELGFTPVPLNGEPALEESLQRYIARNREKDRLLILRRKVGVFQQGFDNV